MSFSTEVRVGFLFFVMLTYLVQILGNIQMLNNSHLNAEAKKLFSYNPSIELINGTSQATSVMITCHGSGANKSIGNVVAPQVNMPVLTFNFPDHDFDDDSDIEVSAFGTLDNFLPLIFLLKASVEAGMKTISLYGFSAGGGAVITSLALLHKQAHSDGLTGIGLNRHDAQAILDALSRGVIVLDAPLKSVTEILSIRPDVEMIRQLAPRYRANGFEPIDCIDQLEGLSLSILLYFERPDEILSNRDDELFYQKLNAANKGQTLLVVGQDGGHNGFHKELWLAYKSFVWLNLVSDFLSER